MVRQRRRSRPGRLCALLLGAVVALAAAEGIARAIREPTLAVVVRREARQDGGLGLGIEVPDDRVLAPRIGYRSELYRIVPPGVRGPPRDPAPRPDRRRVALLGDSVGFGQGLPEAEIVSARLEESLGPLWEVWNIGFMGWNTHQEAAALEQLGPVLRPDVVVVLWVPNDAASIEHQVLDGEGAVASLYLDERVWLLPGVPSRTQLALWRRSALWRTLSDAWGAVASPPSLLVAEQQYLAAIARIAAAADSLGAPVVWAMLPPLIDYPGWEEPPGPGRPAPAYVREPAWRVGSSTAGELGFEVVDLTHALAPRRPSSLRLQPGDRVHPSAEGHRLVAGALVAPVLEAARR